MECSSEVLIILNYILTDNCEYCWIYGIALSWSQVSDLLFEDDV